MLSVRYEHSRLWTNFPFLGNRLFIHFLFNRLFFFDCHDKGGKMTSRLKIGIDQTNRGINYPVISFRSIKGD